jgi:hypothetical protein
MEESTEKPPEPLLCTAVLIGCDPTTPPPRIWAHVRGIGQSKYTTSLCNPMSKECLRIRYRDINHIFI